MSKMTPDDIASGGCGCLVICVAFSLGVVLPVAIAIRLVFL